MPPLEGFVASSELESLTDHITGVSEAEFATLLATAINALPTSNPLVAGALWLNAGVLTVSSGA